MVMAALVLTVYGFSHAAGYGWTSTLTLAALGCAVLLFIAFGAWERRSPDPLLPFNIIRVPSVRAAAVAAVALFTPMLGVLFFAPLYLQGMLGYTPLESGLAIAPMGLTVVLFANLAGRIMSKVGQRPLMVIGLLLIAAGVAGFWTMTSLHGSYWPDVFLGVVVMSAGEGLAFASLTVASLTGVPQFEHGVAGGLNVTAQQIGGSVGVVVLVTIANAMSHGSTAADHLSGYHAAYLVGAGVAVVGALVIAFGPLLAGRSVQSRQTASVAASEPAVAASEPAVPASVPAVPGRESA